MSFKRLVLFSSKSLIDFFIFIWKTSDLWNLLKRLEFHEIWLFSRLRAKTDLNFVQFIIFCKERRKSELIFRAIQIICDTFWLILGLPNPMCNLWHLCVTWHFKINFENKPKCKNRAQNFRKNVLWHFGKPLPPPSVIWWHCPVAPLPECNVFFDWLLGDNSVGGCQLMTSLIFLNINSLTTYFFPIVSK